MKKAPIDQFFEYDGDSLFDENNLIGKRFGKWLVLSRVNSKHLYNVECDCGAIAIKKRHDLLWLKSLQCVKCYKRSREYKQIGSF
jgi:hypothetical protein